MRITFNETTRTFKLDTNNTSYIMAVIGKEQFLSHVYYGEAVADDNVEELLRVNGNSFVPEQDSRDRSGFLDTAAFEFSSNNVGDFRESSVAMVDENGHQAVSFFYASHSIYNGKPKLEGLPATFGTKTDCMTLEIHMVDPVVKLEAILYYSIFQDNDAIARSVTVINNSDASIKLTKLMSMCLDMANEDYKMLSLHGSWGRERQIEYREIGYGKQSMGSVRGVSTHQEHPFIAIMDRNTTQESGRVYGFNFVYSGNFLAQIERSQFDSLRVVMGIHPDNFCFVLEKGQSFVAPEVIMVHSPNGLGDMTRNYHDLYRQHLIRSPYRNKKRPILINNWEATYFDFDTEKLISIAKEAKKHGIEMLVMDDGWFGVRNDDNTSLGDWQVNEEKLKGGLKRLVDEVNSIGLKFGIWFEPEMVSPDSNLYREHPDWAIAIEERTPCRIRNQFVLDLTRPEVADYVYESVASVLRSANIEYVKWDMNRHITDIGGYKLSAAKQGELLHRYMLAVYDLQERLITEFPNLLLENCSSGGARFDPGMLYYSPQIWCSDDTDAQERLSIQEGSALIYPLSTMGAHVSDCPNHALGRTVPFETRGHVALAGTFGYELDITKIAQEEKAMISKQVELYHKYNDLVREGDYYRIASYSENNLYDCYEVVSKDKTKALITYVQVRNRANLHGNIIHVPGLDPDRVYKVCGYDNTFYGKTLKNVGIRVSNMWGDNQSKLIYIEAE